MSGLNRTRLNQTRDLRGSFSDPWCNSCGRTFRYQVPVYGEVYYEPIINTAGFKTAVWMKCLHCLIDPDKYSERDLRIVRTLADQGWVRVGFYKGAKGPTWPPLFDFQEKREIKVTAVVNGQSQTARSLIGNVVREIGRGRPPLATHVHYYDRQGYVFGHLKRHSGACRCEAY